MPSKVLTGETAGRAQPFAWRKLLPDAALQRQSAGAVYADPPALPEARLAELEEAAERREQQAFTAGFRKGEAAAGEQVKARLDPVIQKLAQTTVEIGESRRKMRRDAEEDLVRLSLAIARRVLHRELSTDPEAIAGLVKAALDRIDAREVDRIRTHPEHVELLQRQLEQLAHGRRFEVVADPRLELGGAVIETARGNIDSSIETQLLEIQRGLVDRIRA
jgi:flagellar assembly protein FliH